ncbi:hypothetical protein NE237_011609 [Protea cynaroides]|uniref:Myb-like domain-containing protein n=1 Tax=Protea cynaroides TaxID=273540 RepID=A0A9Q0JWX7_9MAGN|nr:hypothetical protein NE237_011609 [Protea cynaroides]
MAASSSSVQDPIPTPTPTLPPTTVLTTTSVTVAIAAAPRPTPNPSSRRLPPPCWSHEETVALIDSYREKWYSLRRGNLKASHWQEVADSVGRRCRFATPSKTSVQCRHKVEKLRKRYRTEKQKALSNHGRFSSSWVYFRKMDSMEKGPSATAHSNGTDEDEDDNNNDDDDENENEVEEDDDDPMPPSNTRSLHRLLNNGVSCSGGSRGGVGGFRLRIPSRPTSALPPVSGFRSKGFDRVVDENPNANPNHNPRFLNGCSSSRSSFGRRTDGGGGVGGGGGVKRDFDPVSEMVTSIKMLGEGFVKMEQMKIEVAREIERMRMEMELKRTEMILESQQRIVEAFAKGFSGKKKIKSLPSPDS